MIRFLFAIPLHGSLGIWDELIPLLIAGLFTIALLFLWLRGRRFQPVREDEEAGEIGDET